MNTFRDRLIQAMQRGDFIKPNGDPDQSALARRIVELGGKVTPQAIQYLLDTKNNAIGSRYTSLIAHACNVNAVWLATGEGEIDPPAVDRNIKVAAPDMKLIPVINKIPAGGAKQIIDDYQAGGGMDEIATDLEVGPYTFALIIDGESMEPEFKTGDIVIIDPAIKPRPGECVAFKCHGDQGTFKKYRPRGIDINTGKEIFELVPINEDYPTLRSDQMECEIIGTLVEHRRRRRM